MRQTTSARLLLIAVVIAFSLHGCGTIRTMPNMGSYESPKVYSGTRLDYNAATGNRTGLDKFKTEAPAHPALDLPFSVLVDTFILPVTVSIAVYEMIFE